MLTTAHSISGSCIKSSLSFIPLNKSVTSNTIKLSKKELLAIPPLPQPKRAGTNYTNDDTPYEDQAIQQAAVC